MRPPKFIPTCDSILILNVASTLQWKRRRIRRVAWYAEDDFNVNPTSSLLCHVSCADFFRRRALFLPLTRRPRLFDPGGGSPTGVVVVCATSVHVFYRTSVRSNVCSLAVWRVVCYVRARSFVCDHSHSHGHCMRSRPYLSCSRRVRPSCRDCGRRGDHVVASWLWLWHRVSAVASWP